MEVVQLDDPLEAGLQVAILFEHPLILLADGLLDSGDLAAGRTVGFRNSGGPEAVAALAQFPRIVRARPSSLTVRTTATISMDRPRSRSASQRPRCATAHERSAVEVSCPGST